jgi:hypothetical protein
MLKPAEKQVRATIIHHPSDALDSFGCYDSSNCAWKSFDQSVTEQLHDFEVAHPQYLRKLQAANRRSSFSETL